MRVELSSDEAAEHLGITRQTLWNFARRYDDFPEPRRVGRTLMWSQAKLDAWRRKHPARKR
jgi:predicted DNA-binding transcriptional regulator AlpA